MSAKADYMKKMSSKRNVIKEVFENYGYIDMDTVDLEHELFQAFLKKNFIKTKVVNKNSSGGWPEIRYTGTYSSLLKMLQDHFDEDFDYLDEFFVRRK